MADQQVVLGVGSKLEGRALARIAQVVFDGVSATLPLDMQSTIVWDTEDNTATSLPVTITVISPLWVDAVPLPGGWRWLSWFGFFEEDGYWIWHYDHGWMYPVGTTTEDILFYTGDMEWIWSSGSVYPWIYRFSDSTWLWYLRDSAAPRWFYNATTESWEMH